MLALLPFFLCFSITIHAMDNQVKEWPAEEYAKGNKFQEEIALALLKKHINLAGNRVVDAGSGTANIAAIMAQSALYVYAFDASLNMTNYAKQHYGNITNLTINQCRLENFTTEDPFDIAVSFSCLHWIQDKQKAFQRLYDCLKSGGELLCTIAYPMDDGIEKQTFNEMIPGLQTILSIAKNFSMQEALGSSYLSPEKVRSMVEAIGFTVEYLKAEIFTFIFKDRKDIIDFEHPIITTTPLARMIPTEFLREKLFNHFIEKFEAKLIKNDNGSYTYPGVRTIVLYAKKP